MSSLDKALNSLETDNPTELTKKDKPETPKVRERCSAAHVADQHLNGNIICAIDTETTGLVPGTHDIIEIAIVPINKELKYSQVIKPFHIMMTPSRPENVDFLAIKTQKRSGNDLEFSGACLDARRITDATTRGIDAETGSSLLYDWFQRLGLSPRNRIIPLACNWPFDREFIIEWLGRNMFEMLFDPRYRDVMAMAAYDNDNANFWSEPFPYPKLNLQYLCAQNKIENDNAHTAFADAKATIEVYRALIRNRTGGL